jgi:hypothetical protein
LRPTAFLVSGTTVAGKTVKICDLRIAAKKMKDLQEGKDTEDQQGSSQGDVDSGKQSRSVTSG